MNVSAVTSLYSSQQLAASALAEAEKAKVTQARLVLPKIEIPTRESLDRDVASFAEKVRQIFQQAGIHVPPNPVIGNDFQGKVQVENDHPEREKIEQLFRDNPELQKEFTRISAQSSLLRAAESYGQYSGKYDSLKNNSAAQRALVESEVARNKAPFFMAITESGAKPFFGISGVSA